MKRVMLLSLMMAGGSSLMAQATTEPQTFWQDPFNHPMTPI